MTEITPNKFFKYISQSIFKQHIYYRERQHSHTSVHDNGRNHIQHNQTQYLTYVAMKKPEHIITQHKQSSLPKLTCSITGN